MSGLQRFLDPLLNDREVMKDTLIVVALGTMSKGDAAAQAITDVWN